MTANDPDLYHQPVLAEVVVSLLITHSHVAYLALPPRGVDGTPIYTCAIAQSPEQDKTLEGQWIWEMRPEVATGLEIAELLP